MSGIGHGSSHPTIQASHGDVNAQGRASFEVAESDLEREFRDWVTCRIVEGADHVVAVKNIVADLRKYADKLERRIK